VRAARRRRIGLIGFGYIGREMWRRIATGADADLEIAFVHNRSLEALAAVPPAQRLADLADFARHQPDLVVEMAHPSTTQQWGERILQVADYLPLSVTALADDALRGRLQAQAQAAGTVLGVPHGALMGLDSLHEWRHAWEEVTIAFHKHPANIDFSASGLPAGPYEHATTLYDGPVRGIAARFPRNVNTMVTCALATIGLDRCRAVLVTDPALRCAIADVQARGRDGSLLHLRKEQPAQGVSGTEMIESQWASLRRMAGTREPLAFV
jgi:predicted dinucleotide-utilizing enzyme